MPNAVVREAEIEVGGKPRKFVSNCGVIAHVAAALGIESYDELSKDVFKLSAPPKVIKAVLEANCHEVTEAECGKVSMRDYHQKVLAVVFDRDTEKEEGAASQANGTHPPKGRKQTTASPPA
jgi:hypothetical protein